MMCGIPADPKHAAKMLARLVEKRLGYIEGHVDPVALALFIRADWALVAEYAHAIHNDGQPKPQAT